MNEYEQFKHLLEYFVAHLEWCVNEDQNTIGYQNYIKRLIEEDNFKKTGQGYNGAKIQKQIELWSAYDNGNIHINIQQNFGSYQSTKSYLNWDLTGLNVNAKWDDNKITSLYLSQYDSEVSNDLEIEKSLLDLGLYDGQLPNADLIDFFNKYNSLIVEWNIMKQYKKNEYYTELLKETKNIILTGAPGTGKTYLAKQIAKQMIGVQTDEELDESGQFNFVQFHPSYDYTDFVEGLRPTSPDENGTIGFEIKDGIFKSFCQKAFGVNAITNGKIINFNLEEFEKYLQNLNLKNGTIYNYKNSIDKLLGNGNSTMQVPIYQNLEEICDNYNDIKDFDRKNNLHNIFASAVKKLSDFRDNLNTNNPKPNEIKPFIFIIDEINRGEISKIFGELFFSIDPSYRGKKGAVKTQYSNLHDDEKEAFFVPENVYIIGSMNDIDRSVESFDFAMRRRFTWIEISAEQSAENMNLPDETKSKMKKLNDQISDIEGLNASYHIGAAYFLDSNGKAREDYDSLWNLRIEPLLKEYLRGMPDSYDKIEKLKKEFTE
jgi:5-methylcytosine-specific restriction protein B